MFCCLTFYPQAPDVAVPEHEAEFPTIEAAAMYCRAQLANPGVLRCEVRLGGIPGEVVGSCYRVQQEVMFSRHGSLRPGRLFTRRAA